MSAPTISDTAAQATDYARLRDRIEAACALTIACQRSVEILDDESCDARADRCESRCRRTHLVGPHGGDQPAGRLTSAPAFRRKRPVVRFIPECGGAATSESETTRRPRLGEGGARPIAYSLRERPARVDRCQNLDSVRCQFRPIVRQPTKRLNRNREVELSVRHLVLDEGSVFDESSDGERTATPGQVYTHLHEEQPVRVWAFVWVEQQVRSIFGGMRLELRSDVLHLGNARLTEQSRSCVGKL